MSDLTSTLDKERKRPFVCSDSLKALKSIITENITLNNSIEHSKECHFPNEDSDEIESKKRKESQRLPNRNVLIDYLTKHDWKNLSPQRIVTFKEHCEQQNFEQTDNKHTTESIPTSPRRSVISRTVESEKEQKNNTEPITTNEKGSSNTAQLPSFSSMSLFDSSSSSCNIPPLLSFPVHPPAYISQEYIVRIRQIITSCNSQETDLESISKVNPTSSNPLKITNNDDTNQNKVNSSITNISHVHKSSLTRRRPQFETVRTPTQESHSFIPSELLDCCESYHYHQQQQQQVDVNMNETNSDYWDSFRTSVLLRQTMMNISKRLIKTTSLPMVDTHCHFDLIFDRLYIKHNNLTKYFDDYKDFYPAGLSFELAIHVFWRPRHLTRCKWIHWYSKYLNDERVYGSCGIHPHWSSAWKQSSIEDIERCLQHPKVVAIGEIGLDFGPKNTCNMDQQCRVFGEQLKIAAKWSKSLVIHSRNAYDRTFEMMKEFLTPNHKIHLHCFVGTINDVHTFTSYFTEIKFGFTPIITRGNFLHSIIQQLDLTQILSETDSPYFVPEELATLSRCAHPGMVYSVVETIAQIRQLPIDDVARQLRENARQIYGV